MTETQPKNQITIEFNDNGTNGGKAWNRNYRVELKSDDMGVDDLILRANTIIKEQKVIEK